MLSYFTKPHVESWVCSTDRILLGIRGSGRPGNFVSTLFVFVLALAARVRLS
jgi:hypothetical protein